MLDDYKNNKFYNYAKNLKKYFHAYIFEVDDIETSYPLILAFIKMIICPNHYTNNKSCLDCNICHLIDENYYEDLKVIETTDKIIKKEQITKLQQELSLKSSNNTNQVYVIKEADKMNLNAANSLLKFIEEPEQGIVAILVTDNKARILDTIISRCQVISLKCDNKDNLDSELKKYDENIILTTIKFINYYEKNGLDTLLYTNSLFHDNLSDRNDYNIAFNIIIMYYKEILNYKLNNKLFRYVFHIRKKC